MPRTPQQIAREYREQYVRHVELVARLEQGRATTAEVQRSANQLRHLKAEYLAEQEARRAIRR